MYSFPDELLAHIFTFVPVSSWQSVFLVSRRWHEIACEKFNPNLKSNRVILWAVQVSIRLLLH